MRGADLVSRSGGAPFVAAMHPAGAPAFARDAHEEHPRSPWDREEVGGVVVRWRQATCTRLLAIAANDTVEDVVPATSLMARR
jgi:hypothetical protein